MSDVLPDRDFTCYVQFNLPDGLCALPGVYPKANDLHVALSLIRYGIKSLYTDRIYLDGLVFAYTVCISFRIIRMSGILIFRPFGKPAVSVPEDVLTEYLSVNCYPYG